MSDQIITIDGPSGSGKSTISRLLAQRLKYTYLDTGAMYRAVGYKVEHAGIDLEDRESLSAMLDAVDIVLLPGEGDTRVILDGEDISLAIRSAAMGMMASKVSAYKEVRRKLTRLQQEMGAKGAVVAEGRDMGTVVFPGAQNKFFLSASPEERARRRTAQLHEKGLEADYEEILSQIAKRDHDDSSRDLAPLKPAADAVIVDSSDMTIEQVVLFMIQKIKEGSLSGS